VCGDRGTGNLVLFTTRKMLYASYILDNIAGFHIFYMAITVYDAKHEDIILFFCKYFLIIISMNNRYIDILDSRDRVLESHFCELSDKSLIANRVFAHANDILEQECKKKHPEATDKDVVIYVMHNIRKLKFKVYDVVSIGEFTAHGSDIKLKHTERIA